MKVGKSCAKLEPVVVLEKLQFPKDFKNSPTKSEVTSQSKLSKSVPSFCDPIQTHVTFKSEIYPQENSMFQGNFQSVSPVMNFDEPFGAKTWAPKTYSEEPVDDPASDDPSLLKSQPLDMLSNEDMPKFVCHYCPLSYYLSSSLSLHIEVKHTTNNAMTTLPSNLPTKIFQSTGIKSEEQVDNKDIKQNVKLNFKIKTLGFVPVSFRNGNDQQKTRNGAKFKGKIKTLETNPKHSNINLLPAHYYIKSLIVGSPNNGNEKPATLQAQAWTQSGHNPEQKQVNSCPKYLCKICNRYFENLKFHKIKVHRPIILLSCQFCESRVKTVKVELGESQPWTPELFESFQSLSEHQQIQHKKPVQCLECNYTSTSFNEFLKHKRLSHPSPITASSNPMTRRQIVNSGVCHLCGKGVFDVKRHMTRNHQVAAFILLVLYLN